MHRNSTSRSYEVSDTRQFHELCSDFVRSSEIDGYGQFRASRILGNFRRKIYFPSKNFKVFQSQILMGMWSFFLRHIK